MRSRTAVNLSPAVWDAAPRASSHPPAAGAPRSRVSRPRHGRRHAAHRGPRLRRLLHGIGTVVQIVLVGLVVDRLLPVLDTPDTYLGQALLLAAAFPVLSVGIAAYLGAHLGAG